ncbi:MAG: tRNA (adenosine(37)-N6)-threonylcarbamoyltransferase complex dimerization subunit type 1 TsaB [Planctomycetaceae bacterium]
MRILAIDTSVGTGFAAAIDATGVAERPLGPAGCHAAVLTAALGEVAAARGWGTPVDALRSLTPQDVVAVVRGPGSFTGLRVGVTSAKTLAWATSARLVGVSGFDAIARAAIRLAAGPTGDRDGPVEIAYDAGRDEVFAARAEVDGGGLTIGQPRLAHVGDWLAALPAGCLIAGPMAAVLAGRGLPPRVDLRLAPPGAWQVAAVDVAEVARARVATGDLDSPASLVPDYLRPSYAEEGRPQPAR